MYSFKTCTVCVLGVSRQSIETMLCIPIQIIELRIFHSYIFHWSWYILGSDKLQAVLVPDMKDDIYSLCQMLQPNQISGTNSWIAIFTENGAIIMTSESCQSIIEKAIRQGSQTHIADQVAGIYILRQTSTKIASLSMDISTSMKNIWMKNSELDDLYTGYTQHGLNWLPAHTQHTFVT